MTGTAEKVKMIKRTVFVCESCEGKFDELPKNPVYECGECGNTWNKANAENEPVHKCSCGRFGSKQHENACEECDATEDLSEYEKTVIQCFFCDDEVDEEELQDHLQTEHSDELASAFLEQAEIAEAPKPKKK